MQLKTTNEQHEKELELLVKRLAEETNLKDKLKIKKEEFGYAFKLITILIKIYLYFSFFLSFILS